MKQKTKISYLAAITLVLVFGVASFAAIAKSDNAKSNSSNKVSDSQNKTGHQEANLKNFEKPNKAKGTTNAQIHEEKTKEVAKNLKEVAKEEKTAGNTKVSDQVGQVVKEQEQNQTETASAIKKVETRGKMKTFLIGTDYKNLGQLRSSLAHNRNEIRKLTQVLAQTQADADKLLIQQQLETLMQERERIKTIITTNESSFSLFGWVTKFLANYEQTPINEQEEAQLTAAVKEAINNTDTSATTDTTSTASPGAQVAPSAPAPSNTPVL